LPFAFSNWVLVAARRIAMPRFVILRHEMPGPPRGGVHWDFMLQQGETLRTWALAEEPTAGTEIAADALADHRIGYLDYEGPVSGERGTVWRWDSGEYEPLIDNARELIVQLRGARLNGTARLRSGTEDSHRWIFEFST
jgi:hypothetical protein